MIEVLRVLLVQYHKWSWGANFYSLLSQLHPGESLVAALRPELDKTTNKHKPAGDPTVTSSSAHAQIRLQ